MSGNGGVNRHAGPFNAFDMEQSVRAKKMVNSKGSKKDRIHLLGYEGKKGKDPFAVAATRMDFSSDSDAKLGWLDRKFYVLHKHDDIWYKININSFQKRLSPAISLDIDKDSGVCTNFDEALASSSAKPVFANRFLGMKVTKDQCSLTSRFSFEREPVRNARPALADLLDYCETHESEIFTKFNSLALPMDLSQCKIKISPIDTTHKAKIEITVPYSNLINGRFNQNWFENNITPSDPADFVSFSLTSKEVDASLSPEENFNALTEDLAKTFKPWYETVKTLANDIDTGVLNELILDSEPWKAFKDHNILKPEFSGNIMNFRVSLDEDQKIHLHLGFYLKFSLNLRNKSNKWCDIPSIKMEYSPSSSFETLLDSWKDHFPLHLQKFLESVEQDYARPQVPFSDIFSEPKRAEFDFAELDELLELNGEMTDLENAKKFSELKDLLKQKGRVALLKWHPDKANLNGLDPSTCESKTQALNDLIKKANDYIDSKL